MNTHSHQKLKVIEEAPMHRGKRELQAHLKGEPMSRAQAILAKCFDCEGYHLDGKTVCTSTDCPLYPFTPYREGGRPKRRTHSEETRAKIAEARQRRSSVGS